jgi:phospho-N-acetylmuramoyl-pentapeptide-transferase
MLFHLFQYLDAVYDLPGMGLFQYISFRAATAMFLSLVVSIGLGQTMIYKLQKLQIGEQVRDLGLTGQMEKKGTPTMGGLIILSAILLPTLLLADLTNIYVQTMIVVTVFLGAIGFIDDYIKVFKKNKDGLAGKFKVFGQVGVSAIVASMLWFSPQAQISAGAVTTMPFFKDNQFDYAWLVEWASAGDWAVYLVFLIVVIFIVTAVSNGANLTDGMDGLATGTSAIIGVTLAVLAYVSGNTIFADYLGVMYIPQSGELVIFIAAFIGACIGFLWYNAYPAQVFMGDTGSLALGGIIATFAIAIRKELMIPVLCGIFLIENLSVMLQVSWFRYTRKKYGEGRRIFLMSPLHHHYQKKGMPESKITARFWIVGILLALVTVASLKIR